jgi:hypothetical protein
LTSGEIFWTLAFPWLRLSITSEQMASENESPACMRWRHRQVPFSVCQSWVPPSNEDKFVDFFQCFLLFAFKIWSPSLNFPLQYRMRWRIYRMFSIPSRRVEGAVKDIEKERSISGLRFRKRFPGCCS